MFAITGITGNVGGAVARTLLAAGKSVRAVVRDPQKGAAWAERGCAIALAEMSDAAALVSAFQGADGVFILLPPIFDPSPGFTEMRATLAALKSALQTARPGKVVALSTIGAQAKHSNLLSQLSLMEAEFAALPMPITFLRPAWFMDNASWDIAPARASGVIPSFLQPTDHRIPMVAAADVGRTAAALLQETWTGHRVVELEGPQPVSPNDIANTLAELLGRSVRAQAVPRETWESLFKSQGMKNPQPRMAMLDGFNEGWIDFEFGKNARRTGTVTLTQVLRGLIER
jgi:uncharacterized protein YbjT (DUF2867 family)